MRALLFLAVLGVLHHGGVLDAANPPASVFKQAAGNVGYRFFGMVMWCAAITSVVGAAYTSVSFLKNIHPAVTQREPWFISGFILVSTLVFRIVGNPVKLLITAGALNGLILPLSLAIMLLAVHLTKKAGQKYRHPLWLSISGWIVVALMGWMSCLTLLRWMQG
jgi:Mn2+/Fe2+ NRAMP family transporter